MKNKKKNFKKNKSQFKPSHKPSNKFADRFSGPAKDSSPSAKKEGRGKVAKKQLNGVVKRHPDGFGFFIADDVDHADVYIPRNSMAGVMSNDRVMIDVTPEYGSRGDKGGKNPPEQRFRGEVILVLKRAAKRVVGRLQKTRDGGLLIDEAHTWGENLGIHAADLLGAENGQLVAVEITQYPESGRGLGGRVVEVLGDSDNPLNDIRRVIFQHHIPEEFSARTKQECTRFAAEVSEKDWAGRKDLRHKKFITIDGVTAKDFDDAVCVETEGTGFRLWVAIADVSHYVKEGTALDDDAYERGTSVYFPGFVVPMLPEELSNELCSLKPKVPRLTLTCEMQVDFSGEIQHFEFFESVIHSQARVTYGQAQEVIDGAQVAELSHVRDNILRAADLAKILMAKRFKEGSLDLEIPETQVEVNELGVPVDIIRSERLFAHRLIEELMLVANICAARIIDQKKIPGLFRVHESPNPEAIQMLERYMHNFGGQQNISGGRLQKKLSAALQEFSGKPQAQILNILTLRAMSQAKYSHDNVGHFGLGFSHYSHFTSPIRRYPDLIVHRLIKSQVLSGREYRVMPEDKLATAGNVLSAAEQRSVKAERQLVSIKKARFIQSFVGEDFEGIISSVAKFGVFVILRQYDVDGRVAIENLGKDRWEFNEDTLQLVGRASGKTYAIGDSVMIKIARVDVEEGKIDFVLADVPAMTEAKDQDKESAAQAQQVKERGNRAENGKTHRPDDKKRGKAANHRRGFRSSRVSKSR